MAIELDEDLVHNASSGQSEALSAVLCALYPSVSRIAIAISGSTERGLQLVKELIDQSLSAAPKWQDGLAPWRWFLHHLILNLRQRPGKPSAVDPLLQFAAGKELPYNAFLRAMRKLPPQQVEAFILRHGENLDERKLAIAMDCSTTAAANHLAAANQSLRLVASESFNERLEEFKTAYQNLSPDLQAVQLYISTRVRNFVVPRQTIRWTLRIFVLLLILAIAYFAWRAFVYMSS